MEKYDIDGPFIDPVVRCDSCNKMVNRKTVLKTGSCLCGSRKVKRVASMTPDEMKTAKKWDIDPDFIALFEEVEDD